MGWEGPEAGLDAVVKREISSSARNRTPIPFDSRSCHAHYIHWVSNLCSSRVAVDCYRIAKISWLYWIWAGWRSGNLLDSHSRCSRFECRPGYLLSWLKFFVVSWFIQANSRASTSVSPWLLISGPFKIHNSIIILSFDTVYSRCS
jgi:hypothetical protein